MLEVNGLCCRRGDTLILKDFSMQLQKGSVVQLRGPNGCGKSSLLRILAGLSVASAGEILWQGERISQNRHSFLMDLLYIGHQPGVTLQLTARENISFLVGLSARITDEEIEQALWQMGLSGFEDNLCYQLSAGQKQRVALAQLVFSKKKLWVLDEPFTALDQQAVAKLERYMTDHAENGGMVLLTTHHKFEQNYRHFTVIDLSEYQPEHDSDD